MTHEQEIMVRDALVKIARGRAGAGGTPLSRDESRETARMVCISLGWAWSEGIEKAMEFADGHRG